MGMLDGFNFGNVFGKVMKQHPKADARLVNDILRFVKEDMILAEGGCPKCEAGISPHRNCIMR